LGITFHSIHRAESYTQVIHKLYTGYPQEGEKTKMSLLIKDNSYITFAEALIRQAKKIIRIASFKLEVSQKPRGRDLKRLFETLTTKAKSGCKISVLINWNDNKRSVAKTNFSAAQTLKSSGIPVRYLKNNRCCHSKILIIDDTHAIIGSHNWSIRSLENNFEMSLLTTEEEILQSLISIFDHSFQEAKNF